MVFLGGAVLANLVRIRLPLGQLNQMLTRVDRRQGRHVGDQAGLGGARPAGVGQVESFSVVGCFDCAFFLYIRFQYIHT